MASGETRLPRGQRAQREGTDGASKGKGQRVKGKGQRAKDKKTKGKGPPLFFLERGQLTLPSLKHMAHISTLPIHSSPHSSFILYSPFAN